VLREKPGGDQRADMKTMIALAMVVLLALGLLFVWDDIVLGTPGNLQGSIAFIVCSAVTALFGRIFYLLTGD
jgi:hypothetical protein